MLELGPESPKIASRSGCSGGDAGTRLCDSRTRRRGGDCERRHRIGFAARTHAIFPSSDEAAGFVAETIEPGDLLLVKGSRGVRMEKIVEALRARYALVGDAAPTPVARQGRH